STPRRRLPTSFGNCDADPCGNAEPNHAKPERDRYERGRRGGTDGTGTERYGQWGQQAREAFVVLHELRERIGGQQAREDDGTTGAGRLRMLRGSWPGNRRIYALPPRGARGARGAARASPT